MAKELPVSQSEDVAACAGKQASKSHPYIGMGFAVLSFFVFTLLGVFAKKLSDSMDVFAIVFFRNLFGVICLGGYLVYTKNLPLLHTGKPYVHLLRGLCGTAGIVTTYMAFAHLTISQAMVIFFSSSLIAPFLGLLVLKEKIGTHRIVAIMIGFAGIVIAAQPDAGAPLFGVIIAFVCAIFHAMGDLTLRWLGKSEDAKTTAFYFFLTATVTMSFALPFVDWMPDADVLWMLIALSIGALVAQLSLTQGYRMVDISVVSSTKYTALVWGALFDLSIWGIIPGVHVFIGGLIIIGSNLYVMYRENKRNKNDDMQRVVRASVK